MNQKLYFIVNRGARTGRASGVWHKVQKLLCKKQIDYKAYETKYENHAAQLAQKISEQPVPVVYLVVVGGDGTINEVLNGITDFEKVRLGIIPTGSGNDFGRNLWIPKSPQKCLAQILRCIEREQNEKMPIPRLDLGQVIWEGCDRPRIFGISAGIGLDAIVCKKALHSRLKKILNFFHMGKLVYLIFTIQSLFGMDTAEVHYRIKEGEQGTLHKMIFSAAMNLRAEGGGVPMAPKASPTDGLLSLSSASGIPKWKTFFCLPILVAAKHERIRGFSVINTASVSLSSDKPMVLHADGEYCGDVRKAEFTCLSGKLQLLR